MMRTFLLAALLLVASCGQPDQPAAPANEALAAPPAAPAAKPAVPSLAGQWRVTTPAALDLAIGDGTATLSSGCLRRGFTFSQNRNAVVFTSAPASSTNCGRSPSADEETAFAALDDANLAIFAKDNKKVTLSGLGGMLALERR